MYAGRMWQAGLCESCSAARAYFRDLGVLNEILLQQMHNSSTLRPRELYVFVCVVLYLGVSAIGDSN